MENTEIQKLLNTWSLAEPGMEILAVDGILGPKSRAMAKLFQKEHGLKVDGIVGPNTRYELTFYRYKNFRKWEFRCRCGGAHCDGYPAKVDVGLLERLQKVRDHYGVPVTVTSGLRCKAHNCLSGGAEGSQHLYGRAADFVAAGVEMESLYSYMNDINPDGGLIRYDTFHHVDRRGYNLRLDYRNR